MKVAQRIGLLHLAAVALLACLPAALLADGYKTIRHSERALPAGLQRSLNGFHADYESVSAFNHPKPHFAAVVLHKAEARLYYSSSSESLDDALKWALRRCSDSAQCVLYETLAPAAN